MQVTHVSDHVTHATISSAQAIDFGISDSAEFFNILSSTLYSDQILAVVRETLCNAWDAHIEAGITDKSIQISLIRTKKENYEESFQLIIRDFGTGIPKARMGLIYGTYGGSTKKNDGQQTGGFGLGCKAPFAYTDHFEVTSWCESLKTIYNLSKSNAEVGGKPSIMPIVSIPTDETGLQVKIDIKNYEDFDKFRQLIKRIVSNGEMNALLDNEKLPTIPFSEANLGFLVTRKEITTNTSQKIFLRYGNVIYPIEDNEEYTNHYKDVKKFLDHLPAENYNSTRWKIIFQAQPHSISVTPSRESLSMQKHTIEAIKDLLEIFCKKTRTELYSECVKVTQESVNLGFNQVGNTPGNLLKKFDNIPNLNLLKGELSTDNRDTITQFNQMVKQYLAYGYPSFNGFNKRDLRMRLSTLMEQGFGGLKARGLIQSYLKELNKTWSYKKHNSTWLHRRVLAPIYKQVNSDPEMDIKKLFVYGWNDTIRYYNDPKIKHHPIMNYKNNGIMSGMPFIRNLVILSYNRVDVEDRASDTVMMKQWFGDPKDSLLYIVSRSTKKVVAARKFFDDLGYNVLDLTKLHHGETPTMLEPVKIDRKPKKKGIPILKAILTEPEGKRIDTALARLDDVERIDNPEFFIKISERNSSSSLPELSITNSKFIINLFGDRGGIIVNSNQESKYTTLGIKEFEIFIIEQFEQYVSTSPTFMNGLTFKTSRYNKLNEYRHDSWRDILNMIQADTHLAQYFGIEEVSNELDKKWYSVWENYEHKARYAGSDSSLKKIYELFGKSKTSDKLIEVTQNFMDNKVDNKLELIRVDQAKNILSSDKYDQKMKDRVRDFIVDLIEG